MSNPWGLTPGEILAVEAYIEHGSEKTAGAALGKSGKTISMQVRRAMKRMKARTRVHCALMYDRAFNPSRAVHGDS